MSFPAERLFRKRAEGTGSSASESIESESEESEQGDKVSSLSTTELRLVQNELPMYLERENVSVKVFPEALKN